MRRIPFSDPVRRPAPRTLIALGVPVLLTGIGTIIVLDGDSTSETTSGIEAAGEPSTEQATDDLVAATSADVLALMSDTRSLDGSGNNVDAMELGAAGQIFPRQTDANDAEGDDADRPRRADRRRDVETRRDRDRPRRPRREG